MTERSRIINVPLSISIVALLLFGHFEVYADTLKTTAADTQAYSSSITINNPQLARQNWTLNCRGCHKIGATGLEPDMPNLNGEVAKLLNVEGGLEYIGRVNGIANAPLSDTVLADLVNWMFVTYDPLNIPEGFTGVSPEQINWLRQQPLDHDILKKRQDLAHAIEQLDLNNRSQETTK